MTTRRLSESEPRPVGRKEETMQKKQLWKLEIRTTSHRVLGTVHLPHSGAASMGELFGRFAGELDDLRATCGVPVVAQSAGYYWCRTLVEADRDIRVVREPSQDAAAVAAQAAREAGTRLHGNLRWQDPVSCRVVPTFDGRRVVVIEPDGMRTECRRMLDECDKANEIETRGLRDELEYWRTLAGSNQRLWKWSVFACAACLVCDFLLRCCIGGAP